MSYWDNSRELHKKLKPLYKNKNLFKEIIPWLYLDPAIMGSFSFKMIGDLVSPDSSRYNKLSSFSKQEDVISSLLKKEVRDSGDEFQKVLHLSSITKYRYIKNIEYFEQR